MQSEPMQVVLLAMQKEHVKCPQCLKVKCAVQPKQKTTAVGSAAATKRSLLEARQLEEGGEKLGQTYGGRHCLAAFS